MARVRKTKEAEIVTETIPDDSVPVRRPRKRRLPIYVTEDGQADVSLLDEASRTSLREALSEEPAAPAVDPCVCGVLVSTIASLEATILSSRTGVPRDMMLDVVGPHEPIKTMLSETLAKVLSKWNAFGRYHDEILLLGLLAAWQGGVIDAVRSLQAKSTDGVTVQ
jgi:hypothetical protein